ncbi:Pyrroline-5-carboxylate reductase [Corynebacterium kalinowskii]|uniref:Pyrroline-5-carboxylate reductase n=1 Tax=Corynebacterium kalinowskii TaxID=2675216 RepID=A0A6B8W764_9CORY|nr:pyrroline-5-carboxylate reductase [Corynebacterium kalinowskii]QGU02958.1 Pyrroline-5-carboxylate reductase [Corynebacterium kalinowskii]
MTKIAVIGGGKIGEALISGLVAGGHSPKDIHVANRRPERGKELVETYAITDYTDVNQCIEDVDVVFMCVKPKDTLSILASMSDTLDNNAEDTTVISMAAGVTLKSLEEVVSAGTPIVRVMPNTPMLVRRGTSVMSPGRFVGEEQLEQIKGLLGTVGDVFVVDESHMDAVVAMSGSSPAYFFLFVEAMIDAGINLGLPRAVAKELAVSSLVGSGHLMQESCEEPAVLRANVSSPGGTTIRAIRELEQSGLRGMVYRATEKCAQRSNELGAVKASAVEDEAE